ncbi:hypothetical protein [Nocardioides sp.]|uniref:hypothetical protein n=1 Tax=Nocardioides sp. TaxID=35761 RepID=UPI00351158CF
MSAVSLVLVHLAQLVQLVPLASGDGGIWLLAAGPVGAVGTYWLIYRYYRNTDKSHAYERDTLIEAQQVTGGEDKIDHIGRTRDSDIDGDNRHSHRQRVQRVQ